jgi:sphingomyelin phosphodiesterase D
MALKMASQLNERQNFLDSGGAMGRRMLERSAVWTVVIALTTAGAVTASASPSSAKNGRPVWAGGHRVLEKKYIPAALNSGANALEIDLTGRKDKGHIWYAQHDPYGAGDTASDMFDDIARRKRGGSNISFVWFDIKTPNRCKSSIMKENPCSMEHLIKMARQKLEPAGVRVLYGFTRDAYSKEAHPTGWEDMKRAGVNSMEAIDFNGKCDQVLKDFSHYAKFVPADRRIMDYGYFHLDWGFKTTKAELAKCVKERNQGKLKRVFSWTVTAARKKETQELLSDVGIDGLLYGRPAKQFENEESPKAIQPIKDTINNSKGTLRFANTSDVPF